MPLNSTQSILKIYDARNRLLIAKPFPSAQAAQEWATGYYASLTPDRQDNIALPLTIEIAALPPRI